MPDTVDLRVLLVDDDPEELTLTCDLLAAAPGSYRLDHVATSAEALQAFARGDHDVYLVDYRLAGIDGIELIRRARELGCEGPFVLLTGQGEEETDVLALRAGASDYLVKRTVTPELLARSIRYAIERQALERRMRESLRLEVVGVLAGGVAHEYNNLLMAISGHADLARRRVGDPEAALVHLDQLRESVGRAAELTRRLLAYAQQFPFGRTAAVDSARLLERAIERARSLAGRAFPVEVALPESPPPVVGEEGLLVEPLAAVLLNAHEADPDGQPAVEVRVVELAEGQMTAFHRRQEIAPGRFLVVAVRDRGPGMDAATLARAFDPFFSTKFVGRGLGLPAADGIVRGHGGGIRLDSAPGAGTIVTLALPVAPPAGSPV